MSLQNDDLFLVNRGGNSFKTEYGILKTSINEDEGVVVDDNPPSNPDEGDLWYNSEDGRLYVWYVNETTGVVTSVSLRNGGSGYTTDETNVETLGGTGHGLTVDIDAGVGGNFSNPSVNQGGHGYTQGDYIVVTGAGHGNGTLNVTAVNSVSVGQWVDASPDGGVGGGSDFGQTEAEGLFLKLDASNDPVTGNLAIGPDDANENIQLNTDGTAVFSGLTEHEGGVKVTGGDESYDGLNFTSGVITLYSKDNTVDLKSSNEAVRLYQETSGTYFGILSDGRSYLGPNSSANVSFYISNPARNDGVLLNNTLSDTQTGYVGFNAGVDRGNNTSMNYLRFFQAGAGNNYTTGNPGNVSGYYAHRNIALRGDNAYGFYSEVDSATGDATNKYNFYAASNAPSRIPNLQNTFTSFLDISELDQTDDEGNPINWEQPTAATVGTGIYRNAAGALCFARNGECALEIGDGQVIGNLLDKLESIEARLAALEADHATLMNNGGY